MKKFPLDIDDVELLDDKAYNYNRELFIRYDIYSKLHIQIRVTMQPEFDRNRGMQKTPSTFDLFINTYSSKDFLQLEL